METCPNNSSMTTGVFKLWQTNKKESYHCCLLRTSYFPSNCSSGRCFPADDQGHAPSCVSPSAGAMKALWAFNAGVGSGTGAESQRRFSSGLLTRCERPLPRSLGQLLWRIWTPAADAVKAPIHHCWRHTAGSPSWILRGSAGMHLCFLHCCCCCCG